MRPETRQHARHGDEHDRSVRSRRAPLVDIDAVVRKETHNQIAVADGTTERDPLGHEREKLFWLPKSKVTTDEDGVMWIPEWLANREGLI